MKYEKIKSIKKVKGEKIYHLTIKNNHNFYANNLLLHNCDYYSNENNDGNIGICLRNVTNGNETIFEGERIAQGIFETFLVSDNGNTEDERKGGIGSTNKEEKK